MSECGRCHRVIEGKMYFIKGCDIHVCQDCAHEAYEKCQCCGGYFAGEDIVYPGDGDAMCIWCVSERYLICPHCCEYIKKDEAVEFHGHLMCGDCRDNYFSQCDCCHERFETTELMEVDNADGESVNVCPSCLRKKFRRCVDCGSVAANHIMFEGKTYCSDCCEKCWNCGKMTPINRLENINTADGYHDICPVCCPLFDQCGLCGNEYLKTKLHEIDGDWYCEACLPKYIAQLDDEEKAQAMRQLNASLVGAAAGLAIFHGLNAMNKRGHDQLRSPAPADDEAQFDDGYPDDYVGDGLDGTDDYVGDGLDGSDGYNANHKKREGRLFMNNEKMRQILEDQWEEGVHFVAAAIFHGSYSYAKFLSTNPEKRSKKYVDDWLNGQLSSPKYKGKIIPGFND